MESVWQHGGSIRVKISKKLPFDFHPTTGGFTILFLIFLQELALIFWPVLQPEFVLWKTWFMISPAMFVIGILFFMRHDSPQIWAHFIGTDVKCRDQAHQDAMLDWAWANHRLWSEFTERVATPPEGQFSVRFRSRDKALLAKLSVP